MTPRHGVPRGEKSTAGGSNGSPRKNPDHVAKHTPTSQRDDRGARAAGPRESRLRIPRWLGGRG